MEQIDAKAEAWARAGIDALTHAREHMGRAGETDRRIALVSIDQGVEALITSFLRRGPGAGDNGPDATNARRPGANFRMKRDYVLAIAERNGVTTPPSDDFSLVRSIRNDIQHSGEWVIPTAADVAVAFNIARATVQALDCLDAAASVLPPVVEKVDTGFEVRYGAQPGMQVIAGRDLAEFAWDVSTQIDPDQDGLHVRVLGDRLAAMGAVGRSPTSLRDALNHAHDLFDAQGGAVWSWKQVTRDINDGISGRPLADVVEAVLAAKDPLGRGMHAGRDILPILDLWQVNVRGQDRPASIRSAIGSDPRFETVPDTGNIPGERLRTAYRLKR